MFTKTNKHRKVKKKRKSNVKQFNNKECIYLQLKLERFEKDVDVAEKKNTSVCKVLDEIRIGVDKLLKVHCSLFV